MSEQDFYRKQMPNETTSQNYTFPIELKELSLNNVFIKFSRDVHKYLIEEIADRYITDMPDGPCCFVDECYLLSPESLQKYFFVRNCLEEPYWLLQIDKGVLKNKKETKKCDCAVLNKYSIAFIEFKANMTTFKEATIKKEYLKAQMQLESIINLFKKYHGNSFSSIREVSAYICSNRLFPSFNGIQQNSSVEFKKNTGIPLSFNKQLTLKAR